METDKALSFLSCISSVSILTGISHQSSNLDSVLGVLASLTKTSKKDSRTFTDIEAECSLSYVIGRRKPQLRCLRDPSGDKNTIPMPLSFLDPA